MSEMRSNAKGNLHIILVTRMQSSQGNQNATQIEGDHNDPSLYTTGSYDAVVILTRTVIN